MTDNDAPRVALYARTAAGRPLRAALYARVSTTDKGQDPELQLVDLRKAAEARGWSVVGEYTDNGVSGAKESRPALDRMLRDVKAKRVDVVAVWKLDRLGRSLQHLLRLLSDMDAAGVAFVSTGDSGMDTTTANGRFMFQIIGAVAEFERSMIRMRVQAGVTRAIAGGKKWGRQVVAIDLTAPRLLLAQGRSQRQVALMLGLNERTLRRRLNEAAAAAQTPTAGQPAAA